MPAIAIAANNELMPSAGGTFVPCHRTSELFSARAHQCAVLFIDCRVAQRLMYRVAAIAYEMSEQDQPMLRPALGFGRCRQPSRHCQPLALCKLANRGPTAPS